MNIVNEKNTVIKKISRCLYCNATSYGKGCRFAPHGVHFHADDPKKCSYCGSPNFGRGCKLNPTGNVHQHGINFNSMLSEHIQAVLHDNFLLKELNKPLTEYNAFKLGIIDEHGNKLKEPLTEQEQIAFSPFVRTAIKVKKYLGPKLELINQTAVLESAAKSNVIETNRATVYKYQDQINSILEQLYKTTQEALNDGLTVEQVKNILL